MKVEGECVRIHFTHADGGLVLRDIQPNGFAIAGPDGRFVWADVRVEGETVVVCSPEVKQPVAVCYAWSDFPYVSLFNQEGLPAIPFRTDDF